MLTRVQAIRVESTYLRARSALAMASANHSRRPIPVGGSRQTLAASPQNGCHGRIPIALLLQAGIASVEGRHTAAVTCLDAAADTVRSRRDEALRRRHPAPVSARSERDDHGRELQRAGRGMDGGTADQEPRLPDPHARARLSRSGLKP